MGSRIAVPGKPAISEAVRSGLPLERGNNAVQSSSLPAAYKPSGYGLPCAKCMTYYAAELAACPICNSSERVASATWEGRKAPQTNEADMDSATLDEERERFLGEFARLRSLRNPASTVSCIRHGINGDSAEPAVVCQTCYDELQNRVDMLEAALHIDLREAAQIVYDAVWADPSVASLTYQNAAHALLNELRRRSGVFKRFMVAREQPVVE